MIKKIEPAQTKNKLLRVVLLAAITLMLLYVFRYGNQKQNVVSVQSEVDVSVESDLPNYSDRENTVITIEGTKLTVEVVTTPESTQQGLSGRDEIGADGMLFVFPNKEVRYFWMPDMQFNIDIVWISDEVVVGVLADVKKPLPGQKALPTYSSEQPVNVVLELPSGRASELSIKPGSRVNY